MRLAGLGYGAFLPVVLVTGARAEAPVRALAWLLIALAMCWLANTVAHIHLHTPLWHGRTGNAAFSLYLTLVLAIPQTHWRRRHFSHHGLPVPPQRAQAALEIAALLALLAALAITAPQILAVWLPGYLLGLGACALQGWGEHARAAAGVDHHGWLYNQLWFNDGYHAAHHRDPTCAFTALPARARPDDATSRWPPLLRFLPESLSPTTICAALIDALERLVLHSARLQAMLLARHEPPLRALLAQIPPGRIRHVVIVGGGLFPRSALLMAKLLPEARLTVVDVAPAHLARAAGHLSPGIAARTTLLAARFDPEADIQPEAIRCDLVLIPLALRGLRAAVYRRPPAPFVLVHDWLWHRRGAASAPVALYLCKRINLVTRAALSPAARNTATLPLATACCPSTSSSALPAATVTPS